MCGLGDRMDYLHNWKKITNDKVILDWVENGVKLPFKREIDGPFEHPNHIKPGEHEFLKTEVSRLLDKEYIVQCDSKPAFISPIGCVKKKSGGYRMIHDLRHINEYMCKTTFKQEDIRTIEQLVKQDDFLTSVDLSDAFYHIKVHKDYYRYLSFKFEGKYYSFKVLCFGLSLSPYLFHKITRPILGYLRSQNVRLSCYVDDFIICEKKNKITNNTDLVVNTLEDLGFHINRDKSSLTPGQNIDHIGYTIDTTGTYPVIKTHKTRIKRIKRQI